MTDSNSTPTNEQIARRAYEIFTERGQPEGRDLEHWLEAEKQLRAAGQTSSKTQTAAPQSAAAQIRATQSAPPSQPALASNGRGAQGNGRTPRAAVRK